MDKLNITLVEGNLKRKEFEFNQYFKLDKDSREMFKKQKEQLDNINTNEIKPKNK